MRQLAKFCKNCAAYIQDGEDICPDCGRKIDGAKSQAKFCHNCGEEIQKDEYFCKNCGIRLIEPKKEKESFADKHKTAIIVFAVIAAISLVTAGAMMMLSPTGSQEYQVDEFTFSIPEDFAEDEIARVNENDNGLIYVSKYWENYEDAISIDVTYAESGTSDAEGLAEEMGGEQKTMMGYDGYYNVDDNTYSFTFVNNNKIITVYTTNPDLFDEIEVL